MLVESRDKINPLQIVLPTQEAYSVLSNQSFPGLGHISE